MNFIPSYEDRLRNPHLKVLDFELLVAHPEAKLAVWQRYKMDILFQTRLQDLMMSNYFFKQQFEEVFQEYIRRDKRSR